MLRGRALIIIITIITIIIIENNKNKLWVCTCIQHTCRDRWRAPVLFHLHTILFVFFFFNKQLKITSFFSLHLLLFCIYFYSFYFCFGAVAWIFYHRFEFKTLLYSICFGSELLLSSSSFLYIFMCCCCCCFCFRVRFFSHLLLCRAHLR